jgi:hypothetical protein
MRDGSMLSALNLLSIGAASSVAAWMLAAVDAEL